jgi:hypothetical protein
MAKPNATLVDAVGSGDEPRGHRAAVVAITVGTGRPTCCPTSWLRRPAGQNGRSSLTMPQGYEVPCDRHGRHLRSGAFSGQAPPGPQLAQVVSRLGNGRPPSRRPPALPPAHALERPPRGRPAETYPNKLVPFGPSPRRGTTRGNVRRSRAWRRKNAIVRRHYHHLEAYGAIHYDVLCHPREGG